MFPTHLSPSVATRLSPSLVDRVRLSGCLSLLVSLHIWLVVSGSPDVSQFMSPNLAVWLAVFGSPLCLSSLFSLHLCPSLAGDVGICFPARLLAKGNLRVYISVLRIFKHQSNGMSKHWAATQQRVLTAIAAKKSHSKEFSQPKDLTATRSHGAKQWTKISHLFCP